MGFPENDPKNDEELKNYDNLKKNTISDWNVAPNNYLTKPLITMDLSHRRLSSTDNVGYVSENNLSKFCFLSCGIMEMGQKWKGPEKLWQPQKKMLFLIKTLSLMITWLNL